MASGFGSNAEKLILKGKKLPNLNIKVLITDQANAGVIQIAKKYNGVILFPWFMHVHNLY